MSRIVGIHICAWESPKTTIDLTAEASPRRQIRPLVAPRRGEQPFGSLYTSSRRLPTGGVSGEGIGSPSSAALTAATTAGSGASGGASRRLAAAAVSTRASGFTEAAAASNLWAVLSIEPETTTATATTVAADAGQARPPTGVGQRRRRSGSSTSA